MIINNFWDSIRQKILAEQTSSPSLNNISGQISLNVDQLFIFANNAPSQNKKTFHNLTENIAKEIVTLAKSSKNIDIDDTLEITTFADKYPSLKEYVAKIVFYKASPGISEHWECVECSMSSIDLLQDELASIISNKQKKQYSWKGANEKWLLICAPGDAVFGMSNPYPESIVWDSPKLKNACANFNIDYIFFWDRTFNYKFINGRLVFYPNLPKYNLGVILNFGVCFGGYIV